MIQLPKDAYRKLNSVFNIDKAEDDKLLRDEDSEIFVKTSVYDSICKPGKFLLVGRKGSGKTGLILGYSSMKENTGRHIHETGISFNDFPLTSTFQFFVTDLNTQLNKLSEGNFSRDLPSDIKDFMGPAYAFKYSWGNCIKLYSIYMAADYLLGEGIDGEDKKILAMTKLDLEKSYPLIKEHRTNNNGMFYGILTQSLGTLVSAIDQIIRDDLLDISDLSAEAELIARVTAKGIDIASDDISKSNSVLSKAISVIEKRLGNEDKTILITLDKFDDFLYTAYQNFKDKSAGYLERKTFFMGVMEGLILAIRDLKREGIYDWIGTLLTIPKDKYVALEFREASQVNHNHLVNIDWEPKELLLLTKRRFKFALKDYEIDWDDYFSEYVTNKKVVAVKEDPFLYILRHSLWRPREILRYYAKVFENAEKAKVNISIGNIIRSSVRDVQNDIIENEIIREFIGEYPYIREAFAKIEYLELSAVMKFKDFLRRLSGIKLADDIKNPTEVALRLYHCGVIGIRKKVRRPQHGRNGSISQRNTEVMYDYVYNNPLKNNQFHDHGDITICFHPLFIEYFNLETPEDYVVNQLDWGMFEDPDLNGTDE